jgi:hypothetical protein
MKTTNSYQSLAGRNAGLISLVLVCIILLISGSVFSQKNDSLWKFNSISLSSGETPLSSGLAISTVVSKGKSTFMCDYNSALGEILYFYSPVKQFSIGYSGGVFKNTFWSGPIASLSLFKEHFTTLNWVGWSLGDPEKSKTASELKFHFSYNQFNLNIKPFQVYYILLHYQKCFPEHIFGIKGTFKLYEKVSLSGGLGYMLKADKFLWSTGIDYNF